MTVRDLLPLLPKFSDNSGYDVKINFKVRQKKSDWMNWESVSLGNINRTVDENCFLYPFKNCDEILDCEVIKIQSGKLLVGGDVDESLQLYLSTTKYIR